MRVLGTLIAVVTVTAAAQACRDGELPPQGQVLVYLDTNAPVRPAGGPRDPVALFDHVLVEIYPPGAAVPCDECRREFVVDATKMRAQKHSFGFVPPPRVVGYRGRLVLFRSAGGLAARHESAIELIGYLPAVAEEGISEVTATFRVEDVGTVRGSLDAPIIFDKGAPVASAEGTWPGAAVTPCEMPAPERAVCVPGGAFFMGDPRVTIEGTRVGGRRERVAVVSTFYLDAHEVTVGEIRAAKVAVIDSRGRATDPNDDQRDAIAGACDYTTTAGPNEDLPVICVSARLAQRYCETRGGDLPTEAELEMVASLRGTALLPWGSRDPACNEAVVARDLSRDGGAGCSDRDPLALPSRVLPERAGSGSLDRVALEAGTIVDLGANVAEWTRDAFQPDEGKCWSPSLVVDPRCDDDAAPYRSIKGGDLDGLAVAFAQTRRAVSTTAQPANVGFRCAFRSPKKR